MKYPTVNLMVLATLCFSGAAFAAEPMPAKASSPSMQPASAAAPAMPQAMPAESTSAAPAAESQPAMKPSSSPKHAKAEGVRSKTMDLRHCLELKTNIEIARCAHED